MHGGTRERWEPRRTSSSPTCRHLFLELERILETVSAVLARNRWHSQTGWFEERLIKGPFTEGWGGGRGSMAQCSGSGSSATFTPLGPKGWRRRGYWNPRQTALGRGLPARSPDLLMPQGGARRFSIWSLLSFPPKSRHVPIVPRWQEKARTKGSPAHSRSPYWSASRAQRGWGRVESGSGGANRKHPA